MMVKLDIYRKFTNALAVAVLVSVGWICYEVLLNGIDELVKLFSISNILQVYIKKFERFFVFG